MNSRKTVWVISDGKPGHFNQSKGMILALERLFSLKPEWIEVRLRGMVWHKPLTSIINASQSPLKFLLKLAYSIPSLPDGRPDFIVAAGGRVAFAAILLARRYNAKLLFCGSLRKLEPRHFTAVITLERQANHPANLVVDFPPTQINRMELDKKGENLRASIAADHEPIWAVLIGGDGAGYRYSSAEWSMLGRSLNTLAELHHARLLITTSRRTGSAAEQELINELDPSRIALAVWYSSDPRPVMQDFLGACDIAFATIDSMSMLMETVASGKPLYVVEPAEANPDQRFSDAIKKLEQARRLIRAPIDTLAGLSIDVTGFDTLQTDPADLLADKLSQRIRDDISPAASMKIPSG